MKYDFDTIIPRRGTNSYKWDTPEEENALPMWVADMDFVQHRYYRCLTKRVAHGIFSYTKYPKPIMMRSSGGSDDRHRWRLIPGGLSIRWCRAGSVSHYQSASHAG